MSRRRDHAIGVINATFARIEGRVLDESQMYDKFNCGIIVVDANRVVFCRKLARPVEQIGDVFLVPSSRSDYAVLQRMQSDTRARQAQISFIAAPSSPTNIYGVGRVKVLLLSAAQKKLGSWAEVVSTKINAQHWWHHGQISVDLLKSPG